MNRPQLTIAGHIQIQEQLEADLSRGLISLSSPFSDGLMRGTVGQIVPIDSPGGTLIVEILRLER